MPTKTPKIVLKNTHPDYFQEIRRLCRKVYPFTKPWTIDQLESQRNLFPDGQLIAVEEGTNRVVGFAFSLIIPWDDYSPQDTWSDFTSNGYFLNHNPKKGKTLYGAEVLVDPEMRGRGIGKLLYRGREAIVEKYNLKRVRAGARLRGYGKYKDSMSPHEYVKSVVEKKISDPTLSFQLGQGFVVIDVAKNYLLDDPESLGFAAVIEWLNPKTASPGDIKRQKDSHDFFMTHQKFMAEFLPKELRKLVRRSTTLLGNVIKEAEGDGFYQDIENYRRSLKRMRSKASPFALKTLGGQLDKESPGDRFKIAHAFALQLELVNCCETAYRTWRLRLRPRNMVLKNKIDLKFVLTAHPTESRSPVVLDLLSRVTEKLIDGLQSNPSDCDAEISSLLHLLWQIPLGKSAAPTVIEEAEYLFSIVFTGSTLDSLLSDHPSFDLKIRTWVGGDKDGHPGVNSAVMRKCFNLSRQHIIRAISEKLELVIQDLEKLPKGTKLRIPRLDLLRNLILELSELKELTDGDGMRVKKWITKFSVVQHRSQTLYSQNRQIQLISQILRNFPGLVVPVEVREDAGEIRTALTKKDNAIYDMLAEVKDLAGGAPYTNYVRGFVISHCEKVHDIMNAVQLAKICSKSGQVPIIPLFESQASLVGAAKILSEWLKDKTNLEIVKRNWFGYMEIMLGYSDSSKEIGVLPSRRLIYKSMYDIEKALLKFGVRPVFFHGSGGSVARGGGSVKDQIAWWPKSAVEMPKVTVQGEMVQRTFATKEVLTSQCLHFAEEAARRRFEKNKFVENPILDRFSAHVQDRYQDLIGDKRRFKKLLDTTPYSQLVYYKIGSRPGKRVWDELSISSLRAIPWILSWTQSRSLLPTWWGVGSAWNKLSEIEKSELRSTFRADPFFYAFVKILGFTLAKVDLEIWKLYALDLDDDQFKKEVEAEFKSTVRFVQEISGEKMLIWHRPWLEESIRLRAPHVHILNLLQIIAMEEKDTFLFRETIVGISCGMLTTG